MQPREILFCSDFPLGYHNPEAEERAAHLAKRGHHVVYVAMFGIRDPRPRHLARAVRDLRARGEGASGAPRGVEFVSPKLLPPRWAPGVRAVNRRWLTHQLIPRLRNPSEAIVWIRFPSPELLAVVDACDPRLVVYELVDDHWRSMTSPLHRRLYEHAERTLLDRAGLVLANSEPIRDRLDALRPGTLLFEAAAVDLARFEAAADSVVSPEPRSALYLGGVDRRVDAELLAGTARLLSDWRVIVAGPVEPAQLAVLRGVPNIELPGRVPPADAPQLMGSAAVCLMPYAKDDFSRTIFPVKLIHYLAVGRPVAAVPIEAIAEFGDVIEFGEGIQGFADAVLRAAAADDEDARTRRRERVAAFSWENRLRTLEAHLEAAMRTRSPLARSGFRA